MTNQRFVWRSWERRSQALSLLGCSLAANLHQAACMRYFLPPASIRARPAGLRPAADSGTKLMLHYCAPLASAGLPSLLC